MALENRRFELRFSDRAVFGAGTAQEIPALVSELGERCFVVTDPGVAASGVLDAVLRPLEEAGVEFDVFDAVAPNPATGDVEIGSAGLREFGTENTVVVAVGGGSSMDAAKAIALHAANGGDIADLDYRNIPEHPGLPLVAVPTTAGTGSETNGFGVVTDLAAAKKFYVGHASVKPKASVLDPELTTGLPPAATAATGLDALSHALESLMSRSGNPYAEGLSLQAIRMISTWLPAAVRAGDDSVARSEMLLAAHLAGLAFSSGTGLGLCHAIAHPLGARLDVVHGIALAAVMPAVMRFNLPASGEKISLAATAFGVARPEASPQENASATISATERLISEAMNGEAQLDLPDEMFGKIVRDALEDDVLSNNPRVPSAEEIEAILSEVSH